MTEWLEKLDRREVMPGFPQGLDRVMFWAPPRHTKSETSSVRRPAWSIGRDRRRQFIIATYGGNLSRTFSKGVRNLMKSARYQQLWPDIEFQTWADTRWKIKRSAEDENEKDSLIADGIMGAFTGEGATDAIVDDPFKNKQEAYSKTHRDRVEDQYKTAIRSRLQPGGTVCVQMTRWHMDDLGGRLIKAALEDKNADQWVVICLAATNDDGHQSYIWNTATGEKTYLPAYEALWPAWFPRRDLDRTCVTSGPIFWQAMYQQRPTVAAGVIFKRDKWTYHEGAPYMPRFVQVYDTALEEKKESDYSASITIGTVEHGYAIPDAWRGQVGFPELVAKVYERWQMAADVYGRYPERVLIENKGSGISLRQQIEANNLTGSWVFPDGEQRDVPPIPVLPMPAIESKEVRAHGVSGYQNAGLVSLRKGAPWLADFLDELSSFGAGAANDDWTDCVVHGLTFYTRPVDGEELEELVELGIDVQISDELDELEFGGLL